MRKYMLLLSALAVLSSCEDVIEVAVPADKPRLVLDAVIRVLDSTATSTHFNLRASLSASFFDVVQPTALDRATLLNESTNTTVILLEETPGSGVYAADIDTQFLLDGNLTLNIDHDGQTYTATTKFVPSAPIDTIVQGDGNLFGGDETEIVVAFTDAADRIDYYLFDFDFNEYLVTEDEFYPGQRFEFSYFYDDNLEAGRELQINLLGVDESFFNYMNQVIVQADSGSQGPFQTPAATVKGNFINTYNPTNFALGYFAVCQAYQRSIVIE